VESPCNTNVLLQFRSGDNYNFAHVRCKQPRVKEFEVIGNRQMRFVKPKTKTADLSTYRNSAKCHQALFRVPRMGLGVGTSQNHS